MGCLEEEKSLARLKRVLLFSAIGLLLMLVACNNSTEEKIHEHLEQAVQIENENENSMTEHEQNEQEIYKKIISLSMDDNDKIKKIAKEDSENIVKRKELIHEENEI